MQYAQFSSPSPSFKVAKKKDPLVEKYTRRASGRSSASITCSRRKSGISSATRNDPDIRQRDASALFMVDKIGTVEKEKRKRRGGGGYARLLVFLIRVVNPPPLLFTMQSSGPSKQGPRDSLPSYFSPESSSSSSSSRAHRFPFHPPSFSFSFVSPISSLPPSLSLSLSFARSSGEKRLSVAARAPRRSENIKFPGRRIN